MVLERGPAMQPHGRPSLLHPPLKLPDQASARGGAPISDGVAVRHRSLDPINTNLGNFITSLGRYRQVRQSWVSSSLSGPGGDPAYNLGFLPPLLEHFALGEGKAEKLELAHAIHIVDVHMRACKTSFQKEKGSNRKIPKGSLTKAYPTTTTATTITTKKRGSLTRQDCWRVNLGLTLRKRSFS